MFKTILKRLRSLLNKLRMMWRKVWKPVEFRMDLNALPDEMLTNILKYTELGTGRQLRKLNGRIDQIARRNDFFNRVPVQEMILSDNSVTISFENELYKLTIRCVPDPETDYSEYLERWLARVEVLYHLEIQHIEVDEDFLSMLERNKKCTRKLWSLQVVKIEFMLSKDQASVMMSQIFPAVRKLALLDVDDFLFDNLCCVEVLSDRHWHNLKIVSFEMELEDTFLTEIAPKCETLYLMVVNKEFTMDGVVEMIEQCTLDGKFSQWISVGPIPLLDAIRADMENEFPFVQMTMHPVVRANYTQLVFKQRE